MHRPPLKFDLASGAHAGNPLPTYQALWEAGPLAPARIPMLGNVWFTTRYAGSAEMLKDTQTFSRQPERAGLKPNVQFMWWMPGFLRSFADNMLMVDEPDHSRLRRIVDQAFARRDIQGLAPQITATANELLDQINPKETTDIIPTYTRLLPLIVICDLLGFSRAERGRIKNWASGITRASGAVSLLLAMPGAYRLRRFLLSKFNTLRGNPETGLISLLVEKNQSGDQLSDDELLAMVFILFLAGHETTVHLLGGAIVALLNAPEQKSLLLHDRDRMPLAIEEFLRFCAPVQMTKPRFVTHDHQFHGVELKRGEKIMAHIGAANFDPLKHAHSDQLDITRKPNPHLSFSTGIHFCLGHQLARLETQIGLQVLFERFPNLHFGIAHEVLDWRPRLGMRTLSSLPLRLQ